jgi:hypothetical protein
MRRLKAAPVRGRGIAKSEVCWVAGAHSYTAWLRRAAETSAKTPVEKAQQSRAMSSAPSSGLWTCERPTYPETPWVTFVWIVTLGDTVPHPP